jgi:hypothetical protein
MTLETVEAGSRVGSGTGLGVEKACVLAAFDPEHTPQYLALQAQKLAFRFGLTPERARAVAELAFNTAEARTLQNAGGRL